MIQFEFLWVFILLPLPVAVHYFVFAFDQFDEAVQAPFFEWLADAGDYEQRGFVLNRQLWQKILMAIIWLCIVTAAAKPMFLDDPIKVETPTRDLLIMVDLSASMAESDFAVEDGTSRLAGAKLVMADFIKDRIGDRFGLAVFSDKPFLLLPFSVDHGLFRQLLTSIEVGMAGSRTMLGDAIGFAYQHFRGDDKARQKVLILLTDGNDSGSLIPPLEAAELAASIGIKIYPILLGKTETSGEAEIDEQGLRDLADKTHGQFFKADDQKALAAIGEIMDRLEPSRLAESYFQPKQHLFYYPLVFALLLAQLSHLSRALWGLGRFGLKGHIP